MILKKVTFLKDNLISKDAVLFAETASAFRSQVLVEHKNKKINGKSLMGVLALCLKKGDIVSLHISGKDENAAMDALESLFQKEFSA